MHRAGSRGSGAGLGAGGWAGEARAVFALAGRSPRFICKLGDDARVTSQRHSNAPSAPTAPAQRLVFARARIIEYECVLGTNLSAARRVMSVIYIAGATGSFE